MVRIRPGSFVKAAAGIWVVSEHTNVRIVGILFY